MPGNKPNPNFLTWIQAESASTKTKKLDWIDRTGTLHAHQQFILFLCGFSESICFPLCHGRSLK